MSGPAVVDVALVAATFGDVLHRAGVATTPERSGRFAEIAALVAPATTTELYWAARIAFVIDRRDIEVFDRVFAEVFRGMVDVVDAMRNPNVDGPLLTSSGQTAPPAPAAPPTGNADARRDDGISVPGADGADRDDERDDGGEQLVAAAADRERLSSTPFAACTPDELARLGRLIAELEVVPPQRPGRRSRRHRHDGPMHWRSTLRRARRSGGDPVRQLHRRRIDRPRRIVLIADVSGSMEAYGRAYLYLMHAAVRALRAEAFVFATRLTRLTRQLALHDPALALVNAKAAAPDWSGGTRIGEALREFNDGWGRRGVARGAVVVIVSDGWEPGDVGLLQREIERLSLLAHRIIWVNPRRQSAQFRPLTGGMAAVLPFVDAFVSGHSLADMDEVLAAISGTPRRPTQRPGTLRRRG